MPSTLTHEKLAGCVWANLTVHTRPPSAIRRRPEAARGIHNPPGGDDMASADDVAALRRATGIPVDDDPYTDDFMSALIDMQGTVEAAAAVVWREKAATYAELVNTTESGSSRSLGDLATNALKMAAGYDRLVDTPPTTQRSFTTAVERQ